MENPCLLGASSNDSSKINGGGIIQDKKRLSSGSSAEDGKRSSAFACVDKHVKSGYSIGVGTGSTAKFAIQRLSEKLKNGQLKDIVCVPTSFQTRQLILENHLPLGDLERNPELDLAIDGADEVDNELNCIKGGGGCLMQEKIVMNSAKYFYIIADSKKMSTRLGERWTTIPLEVVPMAYLPIKRYVEYTEGGEAKLRIAEKGKVGPIVTDNNNFILDWTFPKIQRSTKDLQELNTRLISIPGVLETGLFLNYAQAAYFGQPDGTVTEKVAPGDRRILPSYGKRPSSPPTNGNTK